MADREIPPPIPLSQVLIEEYASQRLGPPLPAEFAARLKEEDRARAAAEHADIADPAARAQAIEASLDAAAVAGFHRFLHRQKVRRSALCLSGGGIRSATFGLGVVQGLARRGLLGAFDYLSTVSGGGYLGSWLSAWIHREAGPSSDGRAGLTAVERQLASGPRSPLEPEPEPVRYVRSYSRLMSPKLGVLSADTWTLGGTFLRNLLLNWLVFLPLIAAALMFPRLSLAVVRQVGELPSPRRDDLGRWALGAAIVCGALVVAYFTASRPSLADALPPRSRLARGLRSQGRFLGLGLLPIWLLAVSTTACWAWSDLHFHLLGYRLLPVAAFTGFGFAVGALGYLLSRGWVRQPALLEGLILASTGALGGYLCWVAALHMFPGLTSPEMPSLEAYICFGSPLFLLLFLGAATVFVGVSSKFTDDADREWLARAGSWVLILIVVRAVVSAVVIFGPWALERYGGAWLSSLGGVSGLVTLVLGSSAKTAPGQKSGAERSARDIAAGLALTLAAPVFAVFLLVLLSTATSRMVMWVGDAFFPTRLDVDFHHLETLSGDPAGLINAVHYAPWWLVLLVAGSFLAVGVVMGFFININRFSLHAAYRDRLIRAYLGASRRERNPNPFTGFDEGDNLAMAALAGNRPLHLLNLTLNLVHGAKLAWQDRKAEPFSVTPLHCGSFRLGYRRAAEYAYARSTDQGITLGTAMAISGAAASPNMGYHSSPAVTFLMTLFNLRLGWWLGNPRQPTFTQPGPLFAPRPLFAEALGLTDDQNPYIYLSDGGHFENLGLYEMVLRRCHVVVVSDASEDAGFELADLGGAIAKIRIDLGVPIQFEKILMRARDPAKAYDLTHGGEQAPYAAIGRICYSCADRGEEDRPLAPDDDGWLIYLKASLNGSEPADVYNYARSHTAFPHESTANQLYTEAQFESYRELGSHAVDSLCAGLSPGAGLGDLAALLRRAQGDPPPCQPEPTGETAGAAAAPPPQPIP